MSRVQRSAGTFFASVNLEEQTFRVLYPPYPSISPTRARFPRPPCLPNEKPTNYPPNPLPSANLPLATTQEMPPADRLFDTSAASVITKSVWEKAMPSDATSAGTEYFTRSELRGMRSILQAAD